MFYQEEQDAAYRLRPNGKSEEALRILDPESDAPDTIMLAEFSDGIMPIEGLTREAYFKDWLESTLREGRHSEGVQVETNEAVYIRSFKDQGRAQLRNAAGDKLPEL